MGNPLPVTVINVLIVVSLLAGIAAIFSVFYTVGETAPTVSIGSVTQYTGGSVTQIQVPVNITNKGVLSLSDISVRLKVADSSNDQLLSGLAGPVTISPGSTSTVTATAFLDTNSLPPAVLQRFATTSQNVTVNAVVSAGLAPFVKVSGNVSAQLSWGAPVSGLTIGSPTFSSFNSTSVAAAVPVSFQNHNDYITISGTGTIDVFNASGSHVGGGTVQVNVPPKSAFNQSVPLTLSVPASQVQSLMVKDQTLNYTAIVSFQSGGQNLFNMTEPISYAWKAPLSRLAVGSVSAQPYNATYSSLSVPLSFTDNSQFVDISGTIRGTITDSSGTTVGSISPLGVNAVPGQAFSGELTGYVQTAAATAKTLTLNLTVQTQLGTVEEEVAVNP